MQLIYNKLSRQFNTVKEFVSPPNKGVKTNGAGLWPEGEYIVLDDEQTKKFHEYKKNFSTPNESMNRPSKDWIEWVFGDVPSSEGLSIWENKKTMAEEKKTLEEQRLQKEYEKMRKAATHIPGAEDRIDENQYWSPATPGFGRGRSVNTLSDDYAQKYGSVEAQAAIVKPSEALTISIMRAIESGAPVNNMGFYDEVNWHLARLGQPSVQPIAVKEELKKLLKSND